MYAVRGYGMGGVENDQKRRRERKESGAFDAEEPKKENKKEI